MKYTYLGRSGCEVSRLCLGTMNFGPETTEEDSFKIMDRALELGINFFDTADVYGWQPGEGVTEKILGKWFAQGGKRREKVVLATKLFGGMGRDDMKDWPNTKHLSSVHVRRACDESLQRMQTDYIDLYQMHHMWKQVPVDELWEAMDRLVQQGKVIYRGSSNFSGWFLAKYNEVAKQKNTMGLVSEQSKYSLNCRWVELEVVPACLDYGIGIIPWSPLGGGLLGGVLQKISEGRRASERMQKEIEANRSQIEKWEKLCGELGEKPADVALAWLLHQPSVTAPIIGPRTMEQLEGSVRATEIELNDETLGKIDEIFPGYKTAPEHYAW
jgi:aryl-alcohol dehydrogenase-like predicted oxidoreductase